jgi:AraC-like DNA-binding protein
MDNMLDAYLSFPHYLISFRQSALKENNLQNDYNPIDQSIAFMKTKLNTTVALKDLADHASLSVSHYSTLFQQKTNNSPINYFLFLKMQYACQYLENTSLSIKQIAAEIGYDDPFHFSRTFKNVIGVSPKGFRGR